MSSTVSNLMAARRLRIHGFVQGVGFRWAMAREAEAQGASGWVRNRFDGTVEALVCGDDATVARLIAWARIGPEAADVSRVEVELAEETHSPGFSRQPSA
ncbi:MAG: acylphosphatase [Rhodocyclaceae bacterium]|nr:acylphosphatase [Rhodocyclaceae bacterium]